MNSRQIIHLVHLFVFGTLFLYIGLKKNTIPNWGFNAILALSFIIWGYHFVKLYIKYSAGANPWVNLIHILIVAPILAYIGYCKSETPRFAFEIMIMLGFAVAGYHGLYVLEDWNIV